MHGLHFPEKVCFLREVSRQYNIAWRYVTKYDVARETCDQMKLIKVLILA